MHIAHTSSPLTADGLSTTQEPIWLTDVPATVELIAAAEVAVIGFFQDLPIVSVFRSMARQFQDVSFGISNHSEVLTHYNVTSSSICLFRLVSRAGSSSLPLVFPCEMGKNSLSLTLTLVPSSGTLLTRRVTQFRLAKQVGMRLAENRN